MDIRKRKIVRRNPDWFFRTTWKYLMARYSRSKLRVRKHYKRYYRGQILHFSEAKRLVPELYEDFRARTVKSPAAFVAVLKYGRVCGDKAYILSARYKLLQDVSFEFEFNAEHLQPIKKRKAYRTWKSRPFQYIPGTVAVLAFCASFNYFHWMFDVLPRIELLRKSGFRIDKFVLNRQWFPPFQDETLAVLGIPNEKIIDSRVDLQARKLVVPSIINRYNFNTNTFIKPSVIPKWPCDFLRATFLHPSHNDCSMQHEYIYISREYARHRRVINEEEVVDQLAALGFKKVTLDSMKVAEQVQLFSCAKFIIAPHGAGLTNLVFCKPGTKVIELFSTQYMPAFFWMVSNHVQLDYYYLIAHVNKNHEKLDYTVNVEQLLQLITRAGL
ncbi:glycosyltransferase family 61 protein [Paenibacillus tianmuensis]|nr:glycosyltransferase family 61 protein [Paenibacillus tianmuensis]